MARLSPSSNISYPTTPDPPPRQQDQDQDDDDDDDNNNDEDDQQQHEHEHDVPGQRISSPDYVEVEIPQSIGGVAPGQQSPVSTSSEGYPSWLPKRPPPPAPGSTLHSLSTAMMFGADGPAEQHHSGGAGGGGPISGASEGDRHQQQTPVPFSGGRKPTPRSVRIVSMQDSNAATSAGGTPGGGHGRREHQQGTDRTTTTRVSSTAGAVTSSPPRPSSSFFCSLVWSRGGGGATAKASASARLSPTTLFSSSQTPDARLRAAIATPPKFRSPGLHLELLRDPSFKSRLHFYLWPILVLAHVPLQTFLDFNAVYVLIE